MNPLKRFTQSCLLLTVIALLIVTGTPGTLPAAIIGTLRGVTGTVDIMAGGKLPSRPVKNGDKVSSGDFIRTKSGGFAEVVYGDGTVLRISQRSRVDVGEHFSGKSPDLSKVRLTRGRLQAIVDLQQVKAPAGVKKFEVHTPNAIAGVRGTNFFVSHERSVTGIFVQSGSVYSFNPGNPSHQVILTPGTLTTVQGHNPPSPPRPALSNEIKQMEQGVAPMTESGAGLAPVPGASPGGTEGTTSSMIYVAGDPLATLPMELSSGPKFPPQAPPPSAPTPPPPIPPVSNTLKVKINVNF